MPNYLMTNEAESSAVLTRSYVFTDAKPTIDVKNRTVDLSFSSTTPYQRWNDAKEVLAHDEGSIDFSLLNNKAPLLINHDLTKQIGVVERAYLDGSKARAVVKFSKRQEAEEYFQDVQDGIIANISVGYKVGKSRLIRAQAGNSHTVHIERWLPFEVSLVSVPADNTVGIGRSMRQATQTYDETNDTVEALATTEKETQNNQKNQKKGTKMTSDTATIQEPKDNTPLSENKNATRMASSDHSYTRSFEDGIQQERARIDQINSLASKHNQSDFARSYIENGSSVGIFQRDFFDHLSGVYSNQSKLRSMEQNSPQINAVQSTPNTIGMNQNETRSFSLVKAIRAMNNPMNHAAREAASFEFEASDTAKRSLNICDDSFMVPTDVLQRDFAVGNNGNALVGEQLQGSSFIDLLRNKSVVMQYARRLTGLRGDILMPRQTAGSNAYWLAEKEEAGEGSITTDQIRLSQKRLATYLELTNELIANSSVDAESMVRNDLLSAIALGIDTAALYGTGTNNQPLGLVNTSGVATETYSGNSPLLPDYVNLETSIALANADVNSMRYLMNPAIRGAAKTTPKLSGSDMPLWEQGNTVNGYKTEVSNQMQNNQVIFGDFSQLLVGFWDGLRLTVNPYANDKAGITRVVASQMVDIAVRRPESFAIMNKA